MKIAATTTRTTTLWSTTSELHRPFFPPRLDERLLPVTTPQTTAPRTPSTSGLQLLYISLLLSSLSSSTSFYSIEAEPSVSALPLFSPTRFDRRVVARGRSPSQSWVRRSSSVIQALCLPMTNPC